MSEIRIIIDGKECIGNQGDTILQIAEKNGVYIPTLCNDESVAHYGACGVCLVEGEGLPKLMRSCSTVVSDGWVLHTDSERVLKARKVALELLMSDHDGDCKGPCSLTCPAGTDCMAYVKEISKGNYHEAVRIIKDKFPLPASIGCVCPHPCEKECRRQYVEAPVSIAYLKRFAGMRDLEKDTWTPEIAPDTGKKVAIIGGGPAGLTAAYHLRVKGHAVTIYDAMDKMGGMLRYGIPEYRLPKEILDAEVKLIEDLGVVMKNGVRIGEDMTFEEIRSSADATILAIGAWESAKIGCAGEDAEGVIGAIEFLRRNITGDPYDIGDNVAVVGGGNAAMDACRSAIRLGAKNVHIIYRRTRDEMPADDEEIEESMEEGVAYDFLTNPVQIVSENGHVKEIKLQVMELGAPDASGRRSPIPIDGQFVVLPVDTVISAIGQRINAKGLDVELNQKGVIVVEEDTFRTNLRDVFGVGDAVHNKTGIAIEAIGDAVRASEVVDSFLKGELKPFKAPFVSIRKDMEKVKAELADREKVMRIQVPKRPAEERKHDFKDIVIQLTDEEVQNEAKRCLECGCHDYGECNLIKCANCQEICPDRLRGEYHPGFVETKLVTIERNQKKCIMCSLCVRTCDEVAQQGILGLVGRGFTTVIKPEFNDPATIAVCKDCHKCADICPTGALKIIG
ncbi:MAG: FAD-dependent oxidoreductase [Lachnospiraceae bacterium]|nr:FAD-dependent oxidoreductase [Lachnospiraceae bacterium]